MSKIKEAYLDEEEELIDPSHREPEDKEPESMEFGEEIDNSETTKEKLRRLYNKMSIKHGFKDIEDFYVTKKFDLAMKAGFSKSDDYLSNLLKTIAMDLGYGSSNKEIIMQNNLPTVTGNDLIGR